MNIGFLVDASNKIGFGHWSRCLNLSKILKNNKNYFISRDYPNNYKKFKNINLIKIEKKEFNIQEIKNKIDKFNITVLIIDNYKFNYELQKKIKKYVVKLIVIDDYFNKKYFSDILLNYSFVDNSYWKHDIEDNAFILMRNKKGQVASLHSTATQWQHRFRLEIILEEALIELSGILSGSKSYGSETLKITERTHGDGSGSQEHKEFTFLQDNSWKEEVDEFFESLRLDQRRHLSVQPFSSQTQIAPEVSRWSLSRL